MKFNRGFIQDGNLESILILENSLHIAHISEYTREFIQERKLKIALISEFIRESTQERNLTSVVIVGNSLHILISDNTSENSHRREISKV
ncbi:hypothetical protein U0070_014242 [Myodes glareolus]|uniref:Uncharacterized protein n=1 Tax=Myodes glareolus TaxID=447135 RepID=A0AAW0H4J4_MYOGA